MTQPSPLSQSETSQFAALHGLGLRALSDAELIRLVLGPGAASFLTGLGPGRASLPELRGREAIELEGELTPDLAAQLMAAIELGRRAHHAPLRLGQPLLCASEAARHVQGQLCAPGREEFHVVLLDTKHRAIGSRLVSIGSLQSSLVHPREV